MPAELPLALLPLPAPFLSVELCHPPDLGGDPDPEPVAETDVAESVPLAPSVWEGVLGDEEGLSLADDPGCDVFVVAALEEA